MVRIYLDTCCLNRPLDNQNQGRIRHEAEVVLAVLRKVQNGDWLWITSDILWWEINRCPDLSRHEGMEEMLRLPNRRVVISNAETIRAKQLTWMSFGAPDAYHIAAAEAGHCEVLLTADDRMVRKAARLKEEILVHVANPLDWWREI